MDIAGFAGIGLAFGAIFMSMIMEGGNPASIILIPPIVLVLGGTLGAAMVGGVLKDTIGLIKLLQRALMAKVTPPGDLVDAVVKLADRARREGLLALEDAIKSVEDPFLKRGLELAVDGTDPEELREIMEADYAKYGALIKSLNIKD